MTYNEDLQSNNVVLQSILDAVNVLPSTYIYTPHVDSEGNLSWTNNGGLANPPTVNISGGGGGTAQVWYDTKTAGEFYKADDAPSSTVVGKYDGYFYATRVYNAVWNDYAELFESVEPIAVGHIAYALEDGRVAAQGSPSCAVGVVSDRWGHLLGGNGNHDAEDHAAISLAGRVPVEVRGNVSLGDMIAACEDGVGRKAETSDFGCIIGKCVGCDPDGRDNFVLMLVGVM